MKSIKLSKEFGLNSSLRVCFLCSEVIDIALFGDDFRDKRGNKTEAPMYISAPGLVCDRCKSLLDSGDAVFFLEVKNGSNEKEPDRTGRMVSIKKEAAIKIFGDDVSKISYIEEDVFNNIFSGALNKQKENNNVDSE